MKDRNGHEHDSRGRFTSAQTEARKQLFDKVQFPAFTEAQNAMKDETIAQTLGKKQSEIESKHGKVIFQSTPRGESPLYDAVKKAVAHAQTNAEKYAAYQPDRVVCIMKELTGMKSPTFGDVLSWLNQPAAQDWPEWCKVGAWIAWDFKDDPTEFYKIDRIENGVMYSGRLEITSEGIKSYKPARVRPFTAKEAVEFVGKTVIRKLTGGKFKVCGAGKSTEATWVSFDKCPYGVAEFMENYTFADGSPCGVLEVVE